MRFSWIASIIFGCLVLLQSTQPCQGNPVNSYGNNLRSSAAHRQVQEEQEPERVTTGPFSIKVAPTPTRLEEDALDSLYIHIQSTLVDFMRTRTTGSGLNVLYFVMTDIDIEDMDGNVSTLRIGEGAAAFDVAAVGDVPPPQKIEEWMQEAIDTQLVERLQETPFYYIQQARFVSLSETNGGGGNNNNNAAGAEEDINIDSRSNGSGESSGANAALTSSVAVAGAAILILGALLVRSHRNHRSTRTLSMDTATLGSSGLQSQAPPATCNTTAPSVTVTPAPIPVRPMTPTPSYSASQEEPSSPPRMESSTPVSRVTTDDSRSIADSESSWTVATETGDSAAVYSVATHPSAALASTESFEHDRKVYLQKDMLTTTWSGGQHNTAGFVSHSESVLQPSYFSVSHERRRQQAGHRPGRRQWVDTDESPRPFIFASHDDADMGEEVFLMPEDAVSAASSHTGEPSPPTTNELL